MTTWFFIGIIAAARTILGYILENVRRYRAKSAAEISSVTFLPFTPGISLWAVYGVSVSDPAIIGTDTFSVLTIFMALVLYFHNQRLHRAPGNSCAGGGSSWPPGIRFLMCCPGQWQRGGGPDGDACC